MDEAPPPVPCSDAGVFRPRVSDVASVGDRAAQRACCHLQQAIVPPPQGYASAAAPRWPTALRFAGASAEGGHVRRLSAAAVLLAAMAAGARADDLPAVEVLGPSAALGRLFLPRQKAISAGTVVVVADVLAPDARGEHYIGRLNAAGIAALDLNVGDATDALHAGPPPLGTMIARATERLSADSRIDSTRLGLLAFGTAAGAAFSTLLDAADPGSRWGAVVLMYPGCAALSQMLRTSGPPAWSHSVPFLLLHGDSDPANPSATCAEFVAVLSRYAPVRRIEYRSAGYAWDRPRYGVATAELIPRPDGPGRVKADHWPELANLSAGQVAHFFSVALAAK